MTDENLVIVYKSWHMMTNCYTVLIRPQEQNCLEWHHKDL